MSHNVFVDATILQKHNKDMPKRTFVAYFVEGRPELQDVKEVIDIGADETHEAELFSVLFAIERSNAMLDHFTILCDHESIRIRNKP